MRRALPLLLILVTLVAGGCGSSSLQDRVDAANRRQLALPNNRSYLLMTWDDEPKEWLLVSDLRSGGSLHSMLTFHEGRMAIASRVAILEGQEITDPMAQSGYRENPSAQRERYERSRSLVAKGQKWTGAAVTTTISPYAVDYRQAGTVTYRGRQVHLFAGDVVSPRTEDPMSIYEHAHVVVGLDAETGDLVLEYLANLRPKAAAANRMLVVHDAQPVVTLGIMAETPADERTAAYTRMYAELHALETALQHRFSFSYSIGA